MQARKMKMECIFVVHKVRQRESPNFIYARRCDLQPLNVYREIKKISIYQIYVSDKYFQMTDLYAEPEIL